MNNAASVLIYSCDKYSDVWKPFFTLFWRYWDCPFPVYLATETKKYEDLAVTTINKQADTWTERMKATVDEIPTKYVIGMCEDFFFRRKVKQAQIYDCMEIMERDERIANFNFEKDYDGASGAYYAGYGKKPNGNNYQKSCQPTLWRRSILSELLDVKLDPWQWELSKTPEKYDYYVYTGSLDNLVFQYGLIDHNPFGIVKGKWVEEDVKPLFRKEHIDIDLNERGIWK